MLRPRSVRVVRGMRHCGVCVVRGVRPRSVLVVRGVEASQCTCCQRCERRLNQVSVSGVLKLHDFHNRQSKAGGKTKRS